MDESGKQHASPSGKNGDGVRITEHGRHSRSALLYKALALVLVACIASYLVTMAIPRVPSKAGDARSDAHVSDVGTSDEGNVAASAAATPRGDQLSARPVPTPRDPNDLSNYVVPGQPAPQIGEVIDRLHDAGIHSGIGAFSPPGTSPPLIGLAVPDDYVLPKGYVRHAQATDDGQRIEPILMFSPDFEFFDSAGRRIDIPPDRVVPAHLAPPGLAIRLIEIPAAVDPGSPPI